MCHPAPQPRNANPTKSSSSELFLGRGSGQWQFKRFCQSFVEQNILSAKIAAAVASSFASGRSVILLCHPAPQKSQDFPPPFRKKQRRKQTNQGRNCRTVSAEIAAELAGCFSRRLIWSVMSLGPPIYRTKNTNLPMNSCLSPSERKKGTKEGIVGQSLHWNCCRSLKKISRFSSSQ